MLRIIVFTVHPALLELALSIAFDPLIINCIAIAEVFPMSPETLSEETIEVPSHAARIVPLRTFAPFITTYSMNAALYRAVLIEYMLVVPIPTEFRVVVFSEGAA
jgi:hypothetical protein